MEDIVDISDLAFNRINPTSCVCLVTSCETGTMVECRMLTENVTLLISSLLSGNRV
jgi:hypothetical protein